MSKKQLEENRADLNLAVEIGELGTFRVDIETNTATYSRRIMEWFGIKKQHLTLNEVFESIYSKDRDFVSEEINRSLLSKDKNLHDISYTVVNPETGKSRILRSKGITLFNELGQPHAITGIIQDITTQTAIQKKTEESERNLRNIILQAPVAMCLLKGGSFVLEVANERMFEIWGKGGDELMYKPLFEGLPEAKNQGFEEFLTNVYTTGETFSAYAVPVNLPRNGKIEVVYLNFVYEAYRESNDEISGVMAVAVEVTDQVIARQKTEIAEERARLAIESSELGVYDVNLLTGEMHTNTRFDAIFGFNKPVAREVYVEHMHPEDLKIREEAHRESLKTGHLFYEIRLIYNARIHWIRARGVVLFDDKKMPVKLLGVVQDITEQILFAEELTKQVADKTKDYQEAMEQLVKKNQELEQFAYVASHDLKEPLRMISSYSELLVRRIPQDTEAREYSYFMTEGVQRMQALINDLLEYSRIGQKPVPFVIVDCMVLLNTVQNTLHIKIEETGTEINYSQLPKVSGVSSLLAQLFQNLIDNAIKFRNKDTTPQIIINATEENENWWLFSVSDNGIGIDKIYHDKIFVIFQRLHTRDHYPGTGIGLSVCKRIVEFHGGNIWFDSEKGEGTTFYFTLPKAEA
jgi:PAS domain S-box-containing protein